MSTLIASQVEVRKVEEHDRPLLQQMYDTYTPLGAELGLPPRDAARRRAWLDHILQNGINLVAFADDRVVGHVALMPADRQAEMALFVQQDFRRQGVATALVEAAAEVARAQGLRHFWVLISSNNYPARTALRKFGFRTGWEELGELQMIKAL